MNYGRPVVNASDNKMKRSGLMTPSCFYSYKLKRPSLVRNRTTLEIGFVKVPPPRPLIGNNFLGGRWNWKFVRRAQPQSARLKEEKQTVISLNNAKSAKVSRHLTPVVKSHRTVSDSQVALHSSSSTSNEGLAENLMMEKWSRCNKNRKSENKK